MTAQLDELLAPVRRSPLRSEAIDTLVREREAELQLRRKFYEEMTPEQKVEFIGGEVIMHSPARDVPIVVTQNVSRLLGFFVDQNDLGKVRTEKCLCVFPSNDYEPDVVFFGKEKSALIGSETMKFPIPDLIVEVLSESTKDRDRGIKHEDYGLHGVQEYWIIDAEKQIVEQYLNTGEAFELNFKGGSGEIACQAIPGLTIPVKAVFDQEANRVTVKDLL